MSIGVQQASGFQDRLTEQLLTVLGSAIADREAHWERNGGKTPTENDVDKIIRDYSTKNAVLSGSSSLVPGPLGFLTMIPELVLVIRNQIQMVCDVGVACGKRQAISPELLLFVVISATGQGTVGILAMHGGGKILVRRQSLRALQAVVAAFSGKVTQQVLKSSISRFVPVVGAAAMAAWAKYSTVKIGERARRVFSMDIESQVVTAAEPENLVSGSSAVAYDHILEQKLLALSNLIKVDGRVAEEERAHLELMVANSDLPPPVRERLVASLGLPQQKVDFSPFIENEEERFGLMVDLVAMAKRDEELHPSERVYIRHVAKQTGFPEADVVALID